MDTRLKVTDPPRGVADVVPTTVPLVTIAWRALRADLKRRRQQQEVEKALVSAGDRALVAVADEVFRLRREAHKTRNETDRRLSESAERLESALSAAGVTVVAPAGEPYTDELADILENIAQVPAPGAIRAQVAEVVAPAILRSERVLQMGKAVVGVPAPTGLQAQIEALPRSRCEVDENASGDGDTVERRENE